MSNPWPLLMLALFACGAPSEAGPDDEADTDTDSDSDSDSDADTDTDTDSDTDADVPEPDWTGNWRIAMEWSYECDMGFGNMKQASGDDSWALAFSGPPTALEVEVNQNYNYILTGTGDADGVQLCGAFPVPDISGDEASTLENAICILADVVVDEKTVTGIATGHFDGSYGEACEMFDSPITLTK